jgi:hypothetical protein
MGKRGKIFLEIIQLTPKGDIVEFVGMFLTAYT